MDLAGSFNLLEACFWCAIAVGFACFAVARRSNRDLKLAACLSFLLFGASDLVEIFTGGWWKPWWLLAMKVCSAVWLAALLLIYLRCRLPRGTS